MITSVYPFLWDSIESCPDEEIILFRLKDPSTLTYYHDAEGKELIITRGVLGVKSRPRTIKEVHIETNCLTIILSKCTR